MTREEDSPQRAILRCPCPQLISTLWRCLINKLIERLITIRGELEDILEGVFDPDVHDLIEAARQDLGQAISLLKED